MRLRRKGAFHAARREGIAEDRVIALCTENRQFGVYLASLMTRRLIANNEEL